LEHTKPAPWGGSIPPELIQVYDKAHSDSKTAHKMSKKAVGGQEPAGRRENHLKAHEAHAEAAKSHEMACHKSSKVGHGDLAQHHNKAAKLHDKRAVGHFLGAYNNLRAHRKSMMGECNGMDCGVAGCASGPDDVVASDKPMPNKPLLKEKKKKFSLIKSPSKSKMESQPPYQGGNNQEIQMNSKRIEEMKRLAGDGAGKAEVKRAGEALSNPVGSGGEVGAVEPAPSREMRDIGGKASGMGKAAAQYTAAPATEGKVGADLGDDTTSGGEVGDRDMSAASKKPRDIGGSDDSKENGEKFAAKADPDQAGSKYKAVSAPATADAGAELGNPTTTGGEVGDEKKDVASKKMRDTSPHEAPLAAGQKKPKVEESAGVASVVNNLRKLMGLMR
jgi:hypothetical protein